MDHLPLPCDAILVDAISVPLLVTTWSPTDFEDFEDFESYPRRNGWEIDLASTHNQFTRAGNKPGAKEVVAMLQAWLYFGLLSIVTEQSFHLQDFTRLDQEGNAILTSKCLEPLVIRWTESIISHSWSKDEQALQEWHDRLWRYFVFTRDILLRTKVHLEISYKQYPLVIMSIVALGEFLESAAYYLFRERRWTTPVILEWRVTGNQDFGELLYGHMRERGWCPFKIAGLDSNLMDISALWYFANMMPPKASDHNRVGGGDRCNASKCELMDVTKSEYKIAHQTPWCSCDMAGPEQTHISTALRKGTIPIILLQTVEAGAQQGILTCRVEAYSDKTQYVAISHVWADGHGNPHGNLLPICFLARLAELVGLLPDAKQDTGVKFWLDTLCVPRGESGESGDLKRLALSRLKEPYEWAKHVLVLDSYLSGLDSATMSTPELVARIRTSAWVQRLWTFKEGRLSGEHLWFQFQDKAINLFDLINNTWRMEWTFLPVTARQLVELDILTQYHSSKIWNIGELTQNLREVHTLRQELVARTSSHAEDEGICLANIVGLDINPILDAPLEDRMQVLWSLLPRVPLGMVLSTASQKLMSPGYRWAPASFMGDSDTYLWLGEKGTGRGHSATARPSAAGLLVDMFACCISPVDQESGSLVRPEDSKAEILKILTKESKDWGNWLLRDKLGNWYSCLIGDAWHQYPTPIDVESHLAILLNEPIRPRKFRATEKFGYLSFTRGIVVSYAIPSDDCQYIVAKAHQHVTLKQCAQGDSKLYERLWKTSLQITNSMSPSDANVSSHFWDVVLSRRRQAIDELLADQDFTELHKTVHAQWGLYQDGEGLAKDIEGDLYRFMVLTPWVGIDISSSTSAWCID